MKIFNGVTLRILSDWGKKAGLRVEVEVHIVVLELLQGLGARDLRVVHVQHGAVLQQHRAHVQRRGLARVARVLLEREAEHRDLLPPHLRRSPKSCDAVDPAP